MQGFPTTICWFPNILNGWGTQGLVWEILQEVVRAGWLRFLLYAVVVKMRD